MTKRFLKQSNVLLFSSLIGTVFGLMDIMGAIMKAVEKRRLDARLRAKKEIYLEERKRNRRFLMHSNPNHTGEKPYTAPQTRVVPNRHTSEDESDSGLFA